MACYGFVTSEDWGSWSVPLPPTLTQLRHQCAPHTALAAQASIASVPAEEQAKEVMAEEAQQQEGQEHQQNEVAGVEHAIEAETLVQLGRSPRLQEAIDRHPACFTKKCPQAVGPLESMDALCEGHDFDGAKRVACMHEEALACMYHASNLMACYGFVTSEDWGSWSVPLPPTLTQLRHQCASGLSLARSAVLPKNTMTEEEQAASLPTQPEVLLP